MILNTIVFIFTVLLSVRAVFQIDSTHPNNKQIISFVKDSLFASLLASFVAINWFLNNLKIDYVVIAILVLCFTKFICDGVKSIDKYTYIYKHHYINEEFTKEKKKDCFIKGFIGICRD